VYFSLADDAFLPGASFIENMDFAIDNGCIKVEKYVALDTYVFGDTVPDPPLAESLEEHQAVVRLHLQLVNNPQGGSFSFLLNKTLCDQASANTRLHNRMREDFTLQLLDAD
jgi:hypothetical protein